MIVVVVSVFDLNQNEKCFVFLYFNIQTIKTIKETSRLLDDVGVQSSPGKHTSKSEILQRFLFTLK
jgi:hypothetical protein